MDFREVTRVLAERTGDEAVAADTSGAISLSVDEMPLTVMHLDELDRVALIGEVGELPPEDRMERLYLTLLEANYNFTGTFGATLAVKPDEKKVVLCEVIPLALVETTSFLDQVENFVNVLEVWRKVVSSFCGAAAAEVRPNEPPSAGGSLFGLPDDFYMQA